MCCSDRISCRCCSVRIQTLEQRCGVGEGGPRRHAGRRGRSDVCSCGCRPSGGRRRMIHAGLIRVPRVCCRAKSLHPCTDAVLGSAAAAAAGGPTDVERRAGCCCWGRETTLLLRRGERRADGRHHRQSDERGEAARGDRTSTNALAQKKLRRQLRESNQDDNSRDSRKLNHLQVNRCKNPASPLVRKLRTGVYLDGVLLHVHAMLRMSTFYGTLCLRRVS